MDEQTMLLRMTLAALGGMALGIDREIRGISAGLRTHALVSTSSAMIVVSALIMAEEFHDTSGMNTDPLRVVQGLAQAIGFIAAGAIFVANGSVRNLTSAANVWLAAAVGIAAGAGQYSLAAFGVGFGLVLLVVVRSFEHFLPGRASHADEAMDTDPPPSDADPATHGSRIRASQRRWDTSGR
ncbi:MgtC/SapB family protein [Chthonobacter rhizosphaerae]|uniref:MgtC/SapB family protein n=1 Tax=Chthonobacter rhizosphaerae TaxID=2735553 RepID=UPI0015EF7DE3|nr:MgtC/SapB family protein [Chthonobacter rhizosphaerae]